MSQKYSHSKSLYSTQTAKPITNINVVRNGQEVEFILNQNQALSIQQKLPKGYYLINPNSDDLNKLQEQLKEKYSPLTPNLTKIDNTQMKKLQKRVDNKSLQKNPSLNKKQKNQQPDSQMDCQNDKIQKVKKDTLSKKKVSKHFTEHKIDNVVPEQIIDEDNYKQFHRIKSNRQSLHKVKQSVMENNQQINNIASINTQASNNLQYTFPMLPSGMPRHTPNLQFQYPGTIQANSLRMLFGLNTGNSIQQPIKLNEKQKNFCINIIQKLKNHKSSQPFRVAVNPDNQGVPDYFYVVYNPMDLQSIFRKLTKDKYKYISQFHSDVNRIILNSYKYNPRDSYFFSAAIQFEDYYQQLLRQAFQNPQQFAKQFNYKNYKKKNPADDFDQPEFIQKVPIIKQRRKNQQKQHVRPRQRQRQRQREQRQRQRQRQKQRQRQRELRQRQRQRQKQRQKQKEKQRQKQLEKAKEKQMPQQMTFRKQHFNHRQKKVKGVRAKNIFQQAQQLQNQKIGLGTEVNQHRMIPQGSQIQVKKLKDKGKKQQKHQIIRNMDVSQNQNQMVQVQVKKIKKAQSLIIQRSSDDIFSMNFEAHNSLPNNTMSVNPVSTTIKAQQKRQKRNLGKGVERRIKKQLADKQKGKIKHVQKPGNALIQNNMAQIVNIGKSRQQLISSQVQKLSALGLNIKPSTKQILISNQQKQQQSNQQVQRKFTSPEHKISGQIQNQSNRRYQSEYGYDGFDNIHDNMFYENQLDMGIAMDLEMNIEIDNMHMEMRNQCNSEYDLQQNNILEEFYQQPPVNHINTQNMIKTNIQNKNLVDNRQSKGEKQQEGQNNPTNTIGSTNVVSEINLMPTINPNLIINSNAMVNQNPKSISNMNAIPNIKARIHKPTISNMGRKAPPTIRKIHKKQNQKNKNKQLYTPPPQVYKQLQKQKQKQKQVIMQSQPIKQTLSPLDNKNKKQITLFMNHQQIPIHSQLHQNVQDNKNLYPIPHKQSRQVKNLHDHIHQSTRNRPPHKHTLNKINHEQKYITVNNINPSSMTAQNPSNINPNPHTITSNSINLANSSKINNQIDLIITQRMQLPQSFTQLPYKKTKPIIKKVKTRVHDDKSDDQEFVIGSARSRKNPKKKIRKNMSLKQSSFSGESNIISNSMHMQRRRGRQASKKTTLSSLPLNKSTNLLSSQNIQLVNQIKQQRIQSIQQNQAQHQPHPQTQGVTTTFPFTNSYDYVQSGDPQRQRKRTSRSEQNIQLEQKLEENKNIFIDRQDDNFEDGMNFQDLVNEK